MVPRSVVADADVPFFLDREHYETIVLLLTAGDVAARVRATTVSGHAGWDRRTEYAVEVDLAEKAGTMTWRNASPCWTCTLARPREKPLVVRTEVGWMATAEVMAEVIATWDPL